jgi:hypothetical protein
MCPREKLQNRKRHHTKIKKSRDDSVHHDIFSWCGRSKSVRFVMRVFHHLLPRHLQCLWDTTPVSLVEGNQGIKQAILYALKKSQ